MTDRRALIATVRRRSPCGRMLRAFLAYAQSDALGWQLLARRYPRLRPREVPFDFSDPETQRRLRNLMR